MSDSNGYSSVRTWRDEVSKTLGSIETNILNMDEKLGMVCNVQTKYGERILTLEETESNRKAVNRKLNALWAGIIVLVSAISNLAFRIFN